MTICSYFQFKMAAEQLEKGNISKTFIWTDLALVQCKKIIQIVIDCIETKEIVTNNLVQKRFTFHFISFHFISFFIVGINIQSL